MEKGDLLRVKITDVSNEGSGIARTSSDGNSLDRVIFVQNSTLGDEVLCEITKIKRNYAIAETRQVISFSPYRKADKEVCPHLKEGCGGCNIGSLTYTKQLDLKSERVKNALTRIGGFTLEDGGEIFEEIVPSARSDEYRNKAVFSVDDLKVGFLKPRSRDVIECPHCQILMPEILKAASGLSDFLRKYPEESKNISRFMVRVGDYGQIMAVIFGSPSSIEHMQELANFISDKCELISLYGVDVIEENYLNKGKGASRKQSKNKSKKTRAPELIAGSKTILKSIDDMHFEVGPDAFFQVNEGQTPILYEKAREYASASTDVIVDKYLLADRDEVADQDELSDKDELSEVGSSLKYKIVDLYCGVGTIGLLMSANDNFIIGVESNREAVLNANRNAVINSITDARYFHGVAEEVLPRLIGEGIDGFKIDEIDLVVMDPPRAGCDRTLLDAIGHVLPKSIVYVSCDPATFARDAAILCEEYGYKLEKVCPVDMFPGSMNVETVALLSKLDVDKHINIEIELDELDLTSAESKATYAQIKEYVWNKFELKVPTLYIAQIKRKCGIELREHYNKSKKEKQIIPQCTPEKEEAIMDALRHFKMIE